MSKKYKVIAKVGDEKFVKYNCDNLLSFTKFLDDKWSAWRWFNVYSKKTGEQLSNFTKNNRPVYKRI